MKYKLISFFNNTNNTNMDDIKYNDFNKKTLNTYKVKDIKKFIKKHKPKLVNIVTGTKKEFLIERLLKNKKYIFGKKIVPLKIVPSKKFKDDLYSINMLMTQYNFYKEECIRYNEMNKLLGPKSKHKQIRRPNFPSEISENLCKFVAMKALKKKISWNTKGDLITIDGEQLEVKAFSSSGPISFGPKSGWVHLFIIDSRDYSNGNFIIYCINLTNKDEAWQNIKVNKTKTYKNHCDDGKRPRLGWEALKPQIEEHITVIFEGNIKDIYKWKK